MPVGALHHRQLHGGALLFGLLDAAFDIANAFQVLVELALVARAEAGLQARDVAADEIEDAAILLHALDARGGIGGFAIAEEALEDGARIDLHRIRRGGSAPGNGVGVGAAITGIAAAGEVGLFEADFERAELRALAEFLRGDLVGGDAGVNVGAFGLLGMDAGEPGGARARVVARAIAEARVRRSASGC